MGRDTVILLLALVFAAAHGSSAQSTSDEALVDRVKLALAQSELQSVDVRMDDGVIVLSGVVDSAREKILAIRAAFSIADVEAVDTELRLRVGETPDIEEEIWFALFREGAADGIEEVIVENGVARVSGRVTDEATRSRVLAIASDAPGVEAVTSAIVVAGASVPEPAPRPEPTPEPESAEPQPAPSETEPDATPEPVPESEPEPVPDPEPEPEPASEPEPESAAAPEPAPEPDLPDPPSRPDLPNDVARQLLASPDYTVFDHVQFTVDGATVVLGGEVTSKAKKTALENAIARVPGVRTVRNELRVLSSLSGDDRMRERLFRRIYEDPAFAEFADSANPPIHIIVEAQHVTLTGIVDTRLLQMSAEAIVRTTFGVRGVRNELRVRN